MARKGQGKSGAPAGSRAAYYPACPFWGKRDDEGVGLAARRSCIVCEGLTEGSRLQLVFYRSEDCRIHMNSFCYHPKNCRLCGIYRMLMREKYP